MPLIDADRYFAALFDLLGVIQLSPGVSVVEIVQHQSEALPNPTMKQEIAEGLAPYLIAVLRAKSDSQADDDRILRTLSERFEVVTIPELRVQFSLPKNPEIEPVFSPPLPFYLQRRLLDRSGAVTEAHYTLFVAAAHDVRMAEIDADALGTTIIQMFQDRPAADMTALFARVAVRYKDTKGAASAMRKFLYTHLGVSSEILDISEEEATPLDLEPGRGSGPPPAPKIVGRAGGLQEASLQQLFGTKQEEIKNRAREIADRVVQFRSSMQPPPDITTPLANPGGAIDPITIEQRERGLAGEEEIKRRLCLPGGWEGFVFIRDTRREHCGFDFERQYGDDAVKLEVKTFSPDGRVVVTSRELQAAAEHRSAYYLVGVLEDQSQPHSRWETFLMRDPILSLMSLGQFVLDTTLQVNATELFELETAVE